MCHIRHGQNLVVTVLHVPHSLESGAAHKPPVVPSALKSRIKSPVSGPWFALALTEIWQRVVQIRTIDENDLIPPSHLEACLRAPASARGQACPQGGLRSFHQKSTCKYGIDIRASCGTNLVTSPLKPQNIRTTSSRAFPRLPPPGSSDPALPSPRPPALIVGSNRLFRGIDLQWRSPESGEGWYKSRQLKKTI